MEAPTTGPGEQGNSAADAPGWRPDRVAWLQIGAVAVALAACCRGEGHPFRWLAAGLAVTVIRLLASADYRRTAGAFFGRLWGSLTAAAAAGRTPWRASLVLVVGPSLLLFLSNDRNFDTGDTWPVIPEACSLTTAGTWALDHYVDKAPASYALESNGNLPYGTERLPAGIYSSYPSGMVPFALPATGVARLLGADLGAPKVHKHLEKWVASWVAACSVGLFFMIALRLAGPVPALTATGFLATGSVMFSICGQNLWQHDGVVFWSLLALWVEFQEPLRGRVGGILLQGLACGMMPACRLSAALFVVPFGVWVLCRSPRRACSLAGVAMLVYAPWAWFYYSTYGTLFGPSTNQMAGGNWSWDLDTLCGVLVSPSHGVFVYQPWLLLAVAAALPWWNRRPASVPGEPAAWGWLCLAVFGLQVALIAGWRCWWGGHCWGSRLAAEVIPLGALLCVRPIAGLWTRAGGRFSLASLAVCCFLLHAVATYGHADYWDNRVDINRHPEMLWSWSRPPFLYPFQRY